MWILLGAGDNQMLQDIGVVRVAVKVEIDLGVVGTIDKNVDTLEIVAYVAVCVVGCGEIVDKMKKVAIWIRIQRIPIEVYNRVGSSLGKFLKIDRLMLFHSRGKFARMC